MKLLPYRRCIRLQFISKPADSDRTDQAQVPLRIIVHRQADRLLLSNLLPENCKYRPDRGSLFLSDPAHQTKCFIFRQRQIFEIQVAGILQRIHPNPRLRIAKLLHRNLFQRIKRLQRQQVGRGIADLLLPGRSLLTHTAETLIQRCDHRDKFIYILKISSCIWIDCRSIINSYNNRMVSSRITNRIWRKNNSLIKQLNIQLFFYII